MKVSNFTFSITPQDLLHLVKNFIDPDDKIKKLETDDRGIYIYLPTPLSFEIKLKVDVSCFSGYYLSLELHVSNIGFLPDKIKDRVIERFFPVIEADGVRQNKNEIFIDLRKVFAESEIKMEIEKVETSKDGVKITGKNLFYPLPGIK